MARNKGKSPKTVTILKLFWLICQDNRCDRSDSSVGTADEPSAVRRVQANDDEANTGEKMSPEIIERMVKDFKCHRCALDFDGKFIRTEDKSGICTIHLPLVSFDVIFVDGLHWGDSVWPSERRRTGAVSL